jgi:hypothetical protein
MHNTRTVLHATSYELHATRYMLRATCYTLHATSYTLHTTCCMLSAACYPLYDTLHVIHYYLTRTKCYPLSDTPFTISYLLHALPLRYKHNTARHDTTRATHIIHPPFTSQLANEKHHNTLHLHFQPWPMACLKEQFDLQKTKSPSPSDLLLAGLSTAAGCVAHSY